MATEVFVTHVGYMKAIDDLFGKHENQQLVRHLSWLFVKMYIPATAPEFFVGVYGNAETSKIYRPLFCGYNVELPYRLLVSVLCYVSSASSNHRLLIDASFDSLVLAATEKLMNSFWLDARSKVLAVEKIKGVQNRLWPEDIVFEPGFLDGVYKDFPGNETSTFGSYWIASRKSVREAKKSKHYRSLSTKPISSAEPYLTYDAILNRVLVTMGAVARPMYYKNGTRGMLYGGIGFLMTLQLVKSLDRNGLRWHPNGSAVDSFLTEESRKEFAARDSCRVREANASVFPEIPAVEVAYAALQRALQQDGRRFRIAKNLTEERVFFVTLCFMTCPRRYTPSPYRVDCNKALQNFPEFSRAFQCPEGSKMNPANKCRFFDSVPPYPLTENSAGRLSMRDWPNQ
ncbi:membrane metallo-endopeptidase-like 1 [Dermacentor silvarum]|uniref:membrane metallo-endopeptidase-like 1 n=1 Tax=Dermacentor silvarum TaxID=543639 RepID=UPI00189A1138|nr:membrane metallo-endopeptidase-like 1 [Dermacentor silvarum]